MKKITDKDVEALKAGKKVTKGFIHMQLDDKGILNMWTDNNITDKYVSGLKMIMTRNVIIMSSRNALRYTDSFVDALRL